MVPLRITPPCPFKSSFFPESGILPWNFSTILPLPRVFQPTVFLSLLQENDRSSVSSHQFYNGFSMVTYLPPSFLLLAKPLFLTNTALIERLSLQLFGNLVVWVRFLLGVGSMVSARGPAPNIRTIDLVSREKNGAMYECAHT